MVAGLQLSSAEKVVAEITSVATASNFRAQAIGVDVTLKNAGVNTTQIGVQVAKPVSGADVSKFERFLRVNAMGSFLVTRDVSTAMKVQEAIPVSPTATCDRGLTRGAIVNVGSLASFIPQPHVVQYTPSKHAVLGITKNAGEKSTARLAPPWALWAYENGT
ncbi:hypothetical protein E0Z10_g6906 [Xylaria hypoxylon]|uniref:Uncharacterized protein n=1 Tax=Xylaria hypoxylon TaxID=37992 RepID=A0A4Z0YF12_9PEZI|nr:hypothetical protein E0Z10_g6906 [Xylaria hypoxylon]